MNKINEELRTPIKGEYDVIVAGGGIAGVSAALSAARCGAKVLLLDRNYFLGGLATAGLITIYLPLCDGLGNQISYGLAEELLHLSIKMGVERRLPEAWASNGSIDERKKYRYSAQFNAQCFALLLEEQLKASGVEIRYGAHICSVQMKNQSMQAVITEGKGGREAFRAKSFVDATGDADLFEMAGAKTACYSQGNPLAAWYYRGKEGKYNLRQLGVADDPNGLLNGTGGIEMISKRRFAGLTSDELSEMMQMAHANTLKDLRAADVNYVPVTLPSIPQLRMTRRIVGMYTLDEAEIEKQFKDCVGRIADWRRKGAVYSIPLSTLYGRDVKNLIAAGRCISVTDAMWDITRVIPVCAVTGEAAGTAAAMCSDFSRLNIGDLQKLLSSMHPRPDIEAGTLR